MYAFLGDIQFGTGNAFEGPTADSETLTNSFVLHEVVRGKKPVQDAGQDNDRRSISFFFDETFCDVPANEAKLRAAHARRSALPLIMGHAYAGKHYAVEKVRITKRKTTRNGVSVRIEGQLDLVEVSGGLTSFGTAIASAAIAVLNPLLRGG